jgi:short-subunit dehydrogenase
MTVVVLSKTIVADLSEKADVAQVEQMLSSDESINLLINNAGIGAPAQLLESEIERLTRMIGLNVTALVRLTYAVAPGFLKRRGGAIINNASVLGIVPELLNGVSRGLRIRLTIRAFGLFCTNRKQPRRSC